MVAGDGSSRRGVLKKLGAAAAGIAALAAGGLGWRAYVRGVLSAGTGPAYDPWRLWQADPGDPSTALLRAAILAANAHNTQPWLFRATEGRIDVFVDTARNTGTLDPYRRELHISLGCAIENMMVAARARGRDARLHLFPARLDTASPWPEIRLAAVLELAPAPRRDEPLYAAIPRRHTDRAAYDRTRAIPPTVFRRLKALAAGEPALEVRLFTDGPRRWDFDAVVVEATRSIVADAEMMGDGRSWLRIGPDEILARRDGLTVDGLGFAPVTAAAIKMLPRAVVERGDRHWLDATRDVHLATAPATGLILVRDPYDVGQAVAAGRLWQRLHLWATTEGIAMQPLGQATALVDRERQLGRPPTMAKTLAALVGTSDSRAMLAFRLGYPTRPAAPGPRRALGEVVV